MSTNFRISHAERNFSAAFRQHLPEQEAQAERFKTLYADLTRECSPAHIQACSDWVIDFVLPTPALVDAFGGFITSISAAYSAEKQKKDGLNKTEIKAKIWPLTFIVNELLHTTKFHMRDRQQYDEIVSTLRLPIINLIKDLAQFRGSANPKHFKRLLALLAFWHKQDYFTKSYITSLKTLVESEGQQLPAEVKDIVLGKQKRANGDADAPRKRQKLDPTKGIQVLGGIDNVGEDGDWKLPEWHGGETAPWHLLPAASWLRPLRITDHDRGSGMKKNEVRAIKFKGDNVSRQVRKEVLKLIKQADEIYNPSPDTGKRIEYDQMGRKLEVVKVRKGADGKLKKVVRYETYYGWSPQFLDEMYRNPEKGILAQMREQRSPSPSVRSSPPPTRRSPSPKRERAPFVQPQHQPPIAPANHAYQPPPPLQNAASLPLPPPPPPYPQQNFNQQPQQMTPWMQQGGQQQNFTTQPQNLAWNNAQLPTGPQNMVNNGWGQYPVPPPPPPPPNQGWQNGQRGGYGNNGYRGNRGGYGHGGY